MNPFENCPPSLNHATPFAPGSHCLDLILTKPRPRQVTARDIKRTVQTLHLFQRLPPPRFFACVATELLKIGGKDTELSMAALPGIVKAISDAGHYCEVDTVTTTLYTCKGKKKTKRFFKFYYILSFFLG